MSTTEHTTASTAREHKDFAQADEVRAFTNGQVELLHIGGSDIGRLVLQPGWRWSEHVKPIAGTDLCQAPHFQYHVAGTLRIEMADGTSVRRRARPGDGPAVRATTPGWSATSPSSSSTGGGPATTPGPEPAEACRRRRMVRRGDNAGGVARPAGWRAGARRAAGRRRPRAWPG